MNDDGMRRYFVPGFFGLWDSRAHHLEMPKEHWDNNVKALHIETRTKIIDGLKSEFGDDQFETKLKNFQDIGDSPLSIVSYHNLFFWQARRAFVIGAHYPALTSATALGERILNHLIVDLREHFRDRPTYKEVHGKGSIDDWGRALRILDDWKVLEPKVEDTFQKLKTLRHRSLHFNPKTYERIREDALEALHLIKEIIRGQFSAFGGQRWFIRGTKGACFIKKEAEADPFVKAFYLRQCPKVGYKYALNHVSGGQVWIAFDQENYSTSDLTDEEFCTLYNNREIAELVSTDVPAQPGIITWLLTTGEAPRVTLEKVHP